MSGEKLEELVQKAINSKNEFQFLCLLEDFKFNLNQKFTCLENLTTFEQVLKTPGCWRFIEICVENGCDFYQKNDNGFYPIHYVIESLSAENLKSLIRKDDSHFSTQRSIQRSIIFNWKIEGGNNYLHYLIEQLTNENLSEIYEMMIVMLMNGCNPNLPNDQSETPFYQLLKKLQSLTVENDLINIFINNSKLDYYSFRADEIRSMMEGRGVKIPPPLESVTDLNFMNQLLENWNEAKFVEEFENFKFFSNSIRSDMIELLENAVIRNLKKAAAVLIENGVDINAVSKKFKLAPAFLACDFGHHEVLKLILKSSDLNLISKGSKRNLLHHICEPTKIYVKDRQECFELIVADHRCTPSIINGLDEAEMPPLYYACSQRFDEITKGLLRRGAFIGLEQITNNLNRKIFEDFLNECIRCHHDINDKNCEINIDYRFLMPPNSHEKSHLEMYSTSLISDNSKLSDLLLHPVLWSFVSIKWRRIHWLIHFNLLVYFSFVMFLGMFIIGSFRGHSDGDIQQISNGNHSHVISQNRSTVTLESFKDNNASYIICLIGVLLMTIYEVIQCFLSFPKYFLKLSNWVDIILIYLTYSILLNSHQYSQSAVKRIIASTILIMAAQLIQMLAKMSFLNMSLHMAVFKKFCVDFMKVFCSHLIMIMTLIFAFSMSFYALNHDDCETKDNADKQGNCASQFSNPLAAIVATIDLVRTKAKIKEEKTFEGYVFSLFIALITFILIILHKISNKTAKEKITFEAELADVDKKVSILDTFDKLFVFIDSPFVDIFPQLPYILIKPNIDNFIHINRRAEGLKINMSKYENYAAFKDHLIDNMNIWKYRECTTIKMSQESMRRIKAFTENKLNKEKEKKK